MKNLETVLERRVAVGYYPTGETRDIIIDYLNNMHDFEGITIEDIEAKLQNIFRGKYRELVANFEEVGVPLEDDDETIEMVLTYACLEDWQLYDFMGEDFGHPHNEDILDLAVKYLYDFFEDTEE